MAVGESTTRRNLTAEERTRIAANLFPAAHAVLHREGFPWHRDADGAATAGLPQSSQALALDLFETVRGLASASAILDAWSDLLGCSMGDTITITPEVEIKRELLGEPRPTQVDVLLDGQRSVTLLECKFTEPDGGSCSQTQKRLNLRLPGTPPAAQCNGRYEEQMNPFTGQSARCVLTAKGVRYWDFIPKVLDIRADVDHSPKCPFAGGAYQWMRNLVGAYALATTSHRAGAFAIVYADGVFPMAKKLKTKEWATFVAQVTGTVPLRSASYQALVTRARAATDGADSAVLDALAQWIERKVAIASGATV
ncbi:MAG: hypothetical protein H3C62_12100 [Gemmatimonadaceae bacterium]|nr:hypothetical protein [Gemmatimonadaceae bacterium]